MIDEYYTWIFYRHHSDDLKSQSNKKVIAVCDECGKYRSVNFQCYCDLCHGCAVTTPEHRKLQSDGTIRQWSNPKQRELASKVQSERWLDQSNRDAHSDRRIQWLIDHPEFAGNMSKILLQYYKDNPEERKANSERLKNSKALKVEHKRQLGGNDIVQHHWLYDDADLSKYTMPMTRKEHGKMHRRMQLDGYKVSHINSETDDNGLWGYK